MSLRLDELHPLFRKIPRDEAISVANLGAVCYQAARERLYETWTVAQSEGAAAREATCRQEGADALLESLESRLAAGAAAQERLAVMEETLKAEVAQRLEVAMGNERMAIELQRVVPLQQRLGALEAKGEMLDLLRQNNVLLQERCEKLQSALDEVKAATTKSSHAIGKAGEATVWEMIEDTVIPEFPYAEAKNMSGVSHAADFHLWVMRPNGRRMKVLIDSKKYKRAVNSDEIAKLVADVDADTEADGGIMVSLASSISTMKQFQIKATDHRKPILYLSLHEVDPAYHRELLCCAVRIMLSVVGDEAAAVSAEEIEEFLVDVMASAKEIDGIIKTQTKAVDALRSVRMGLIERVAAFRGETIVVTDDMGCGAVLKATGARCGKPCVEGGKCRAHAPRKGKEES